MAVRMKGIGISTMTSSEQSENLFARELVQILAAHGLQLEQLADLVDIEPATIQRLQRSLHSSNISPVLSPDEMGLLVTSLLINSTEQGHLKAAILATAIKRLLKDQLGLDYARQITEQIYPLLLDASLHADLGILGDENREPGHDASEDIETDMTWVAIGEAMDAAELALQLSNGLSSAEQGRKIKEALSLLEEALTELEGMDKAIKSLPVWRTRHQMVSKKHKAVSKRLRH